MWNIIKNILGLNRNGPVPGEMHRGRGEYLGDGVWLKLVSHNVFKYHCGDLVFFIESERVEEDGSSWDVVYRKDFQRWGARYDGDLISERQKDDITAKLRTSRIGHFDVRNGGGDF